jgi:hypothetical protein
VKLPIPTLQRGFTFPTQYLSNERGKNSPLKGPGAPPPRSPGIHRVPELTGFLSGKTLTLRLFTPNRCSNRVYPWEPLTARMECFLTLMQVGWPFGINTGLFSASPPFIGRQRHRKPSIIGRGAISMLRFPIHPHHCRWQYLLQISSCGFVCLSVWSRGPCGAVEWLNLILPVLETGRRGL